MSMNAEKKTEVQKKEFEEFKASLDALVKKDESQGKFEEISGLVDTRTDP